MATKSINKFVYDFNEGNRDMKDLLGGKGANLAEMTSNERFAWDSYRRFVQMFGKIVLGIDADKFEEKLDEAKATKGEEAKDSDLDAGDLNRLTDEFKDIVKSVTGEAFPQDARMQLQKAIEAVFKSWNGARAVAYRRQNKISDDLGTAVNIVAMVFGNMGEEESYGDYLPNAQGEDVVAGIRNTLKLTELAELDPKSWDELRRGMDTLEKHYRDMCDIEFTIERGKLWFLQTRVGKRTSFAEWVMVYDMWNEGLIGREEGLLRLDPNRLEQLFKPVIRKDLKSSEKPATKGLNASPGAAVGRVVFTADAAVGWAERGEKVILARRETTPDDYHGMIRSQGILTSAGGTNSHAAVVARGEGISAVCGADEIRIERGANAFSVNGQRVSEGDWVTIDGTDGTVYLKELELEDPPLKKAVEGDEEARREKIWKAFQAFMERADEVRRLRVRANADTPQQATNARAHGAA